MTTALANHRPASLDAKTRIKALSTATTDELRKELSDALGLTAEHLNYLGAVWAELERRGENLSELRKGMGFYLAKIASGQLLAETVVKYAGDPGILRRMGALPLEKQRLALTTGELPFPPKRPPNQSCRPRPPAAPVESPPPTIGPAPDLRTPLDEAIYELVRLKHSYGHIPQLGKVFAAFDEIQSAREIFSASERKMRK